MKFDSNAEKYLSGKIFDDSREFRYLQSDGAIDNQLIDRMSLLEMLLQGKSVIHCGCVDHSIKQIESKLKLNKWLHSRIDKASSSCLGVDIDESGINYMQDELGYENVLCSDISKKSEPQITRHHWDYLLLGELIEHLDNPVAYLSSIRKHYSHCIDSIIVTVPNGLKLKNIRRSFRDTEKINTDHRFWFSPYTIAKVLMCSGFQLPEFFMVSSGREIKPSITQIRRNIRYREQIKHPLLRDNIVMLADFYSN